MSTFIQIPNRINQLSKKSKFNEAFTYAAIRSQIKDNTYKASYSEEQLGTLLDVDSRTIRNYIDSLKQNGLILNVDKVFGNGGYAHNSYQFEYLRQDYFILAPEFIADNSISSTLKGVLLFLKTFCIKGTNYIKFSSKSELATLVKVGKNHMPQYLKELESKGIIRFIGNTLHLPNRYFKLSSSDHLSALTYQTIYDYCLSQNVVPPYKDTDTNEIGLIAANFSTTQDLLSALRERCPKLPENVSLSYFTKTLTNKKAETKTRQINNITL